MTDIAKLNTTLADNCLDFLAGAPLVYHCHHFNLFLDQTVDDALGPEAGFELKVRAARDAWLQLLTKTLANTDLRTPAERMQLCQELFRAMGHGRMAVDATAKGGVAEGEHLHYSMAWNHKYGKLVRRTSSIDAVAAGFAAAATQAAYSSDDTLTGDEVESVARGAERCRFTISECAEHPKDMVAEDQQEASDSIPGIAEERITAINAGLRDFLSGVAGDERGVVDAFGVFVTRHMTNYYNGISYGLVDAVRERNEELVPMAEELVRESGHVCVFYTLGGILYSPEWDALVGRIQGDLEEVISSCMAICRALGMGAWAIEELTPDKLILTTPSEYEAPWLKLQGGGNTNNYFLQGAAVAFMRLATSLDWQNRRALDPELYAELFRSGNDWSVEQTHSIAAGDGKTRLVVTRS